MYKDLKTESIKLTQTIEMRGQAIEELKLLADDLKSRLVQHGNYHIPPSQKRDWWPDTNGKMAKRTPAINPQKLARIKKTAGARPATINRVEGKKTTNATLASQNPPSLRGTPGYVLQMRFG